MDAASEKLLRSTVALTAARCASVIVVDGCLCSCFVKVTTPRRLLSSRRSLNKVAALLASGQAVCCYPDSLHTSQHTCCQWCRGRCKSAAVGFAVAGAIALSYSNIFVIVPHDS